jgi:hypothetical protein
MIDCSGKLEQLGHVHVQAYLPDAVGGEGLDLLAAEVTPSLA